MENPLLAVGHLPQGARNHLQHLPGGVPPHHHLLTVIGAVRLLKPAAEVEPAVLPPAQEAAVVLQGELRPVRPEELELPVVPLPGQQEGGAEQQQVVAVRRLVPGDGGQEVRLPGPVVVPVDFNLPPGEVRQQDCLLYTSPSPRDLYTTRMPSSA